MKTMPSFQDISVSILKQIDSSQDGRLTVYGFDIDGLDINNTGRDVPLVRLILNEMVYDGYLKPIGSGWQCQYTLSFTCLALNAALKKLVHLNKNDGIA